MKIDGVDFWNGNRHVVTLWDDMDRVGPTITIIDDNVRVGKEFTIYIKNEFPSLYRLLHRQADMKTPCFIFVTVMNKKTDQAMYHVLIKAVLRSIKFSDLDFGTDPSELFLTYHCLEVEDKTNYAPQEL